MPGLFRWCAAVSRRLSQQILLSLSAIIAFVAVWELASRLAWIDPVLVSSPSRALSAVIPLIQLPVFRADGLYTLTVFAIALVLALVGGTALGLLMGSSPRAYALAHPFVVAANALPKIVLIPLIVLWLGIGMAAGVFLGALMASFPLVIGTYKGVRTLERDYLVLARAYRAPRAMILWTIVLPGIAPHVLAGLRVGINYAMVGVLIAEFFASGQGIGHRMVVFMANFEVDRFFACLVLIVVFVLLCVGGVQRLERRIDRWRPGRGPGGARATAGEGL